MTKIKIKDLPKDYKITKEEMSKVMGGALLSSFRGRLYSPTLQGPIIKGAVAPGPPSEPPWSDSWSDASAGII